MRVIRQANAGKPVALSTGIRAARHGVLIMVDRATVFEPDAMRTLVAPLARADVGAVSGNTKVGNRRGLLGRRQHIEYVIGFNLTRRMFDVRECMPTVPGAISAFRRAALIDAGGFSDDTLAEDTDLTMAIQLSQGGLITTGNIVWYAASSGRCRSLEGRVGGGVRRNWARRFRYAPAQYERPTTQAEIVNLVRRARTLQVFGSGHSFIDAIVSEDLLISLDHFSGLVTNDLGKQQITVKGGTRIRDVVRLLAAEARLSQRAWSDSSAASGTGTDCTARSG